MKIVLFEYLTGGGMSDQSLPALAKEGGLMLQVLGKSLANIEGVSLVTMRDARLPPPAFDSEIIWIEQGQDFSLMLYNALDSADAFWPIAPETAGTLELLCQIAESKDICLLNSPTTTVAKTASKLQTSQHLRECCQRLREHGITCVETLPLAACQFPYPRDRVVKPDDGVACEASYVVTAGDMPPATCPDNAVCQDFIEGIAASASIVYSESQHCVVSVNRQEITRHQNKLALSACHVNFDFDQAILDATELLAQAVHRALPDLRAFVGIDFIITDDGLQVLEINPRLTSSFAGLPNDLAQDVCALVLDAVQSKPLRCPARGPYTEVRLDD